MNASEVCPLRNAGPGLSAQRAPRQRPSLSPGAGTAAMAGQFAPGNLAVREIEAQVFTDTHRMRKHLPCAEGLIVRTAQRCLASLDQRETGCAFSAIPAQSMANPASRSYQ